MKKMSKEWCNSCVIAPTVKLKEPNKKFCLQLKIWWRNKTNVDQWEELLAGL
jgi:hypothetical protein